MYLPEAHAGGLTSVNSQFRREVCRRGMAAVYFGNLAIDVCLPFNLMSAIIADTEHSVSCHSRAGAPIRLHSWATQRQKACARSGLRLRSAA